MRRILHIITGLGHGGAPQILTALTRALSREAGYQHEVLSLLDFAQFDHDFESIGIPLYTLNMRRGVPSLQALLRLRRTIKRAEPDVIHGWMYHGNVASALGARNPTPLLWGIHHSLHDVGREKAMTRTLIRIGPLLARRVDCVVFCAQTSARQHQEIGYPTARSVVIPNGIDPDVFRPAAEGVKARRASLNLPESAVLIGHAARYHPMKNHRGLIHAFAKVARRDPHVKLVMAGRNVDTGNQALVDIIREHQIRERVILLGERSDMSRLLATFDLYVSSSSGEAFPVVLLEAMAAGIPCVTTDVGDSGALVGETGRVVPSGDDDALASAIDELLVLGGDRRRALGHSARRRVIEEYSLGRMANRYAELYDRFRASRTKREGP